MTDPFAAQPPHPWHASSESLQDYVRGEATPGLAASIEPHLATCAACQAVVAGLVDSPTQSGHRRLALVLDDIVESVDGPAPGVLERALGRVGIPEHVSRLLVTAPRLGSSWLLAMVATIGFTVLATGSGQTEFGIFLLAAPLLPLVLVAATFSWGRGSTGELTLTSPVRTTWLLAIRSISVLVPTFVVCGLASLALPGQGWENAAWILPGLALSSLTAAASTWVRPVTAASALTLVWLMALSLTTNGTRPLVRALSDADVFGAGGQLVALALTCAALIVLLARREVLDTRSLA